MTPPMHPRAFVASHSIQPIKAAANTAVFLLKVLPMLPSGPLNWVTPAPVVERMTYPTLTGEAQGDLYRPVTAGPHPGMVVCLGVVPFDVDHPQVPRLGEALARSGFAALLYWSPAMRDLRLDPDDNENIALAYETLLERPFIDRARSGLLGTCVGGSFALMAAASPRIRDRVGFVAAFAPYASMWSLARDIASSSRVVDDVREIWPVDQLTHKVYVRSLAATLNPREADLLRDVSGDSAAQVDPHSLSEDGRAIHRLFTASGIEEAETALRQLPGTMKERLSAMSPLTYLSDVNAPLITIGHDRDDLVIPVASHDDSPARSPGGAASITPSSRCSNMPTRPSAGCRRCAWRGSWASSTATSTRCFDSPRRHESLDDA